MNINLSVLYFTYHYIVLGIWPYCRAKLAFANSTNGQIKRHSSIYFTIFLAGTIKWVWYIILFLSLTEVQSAVQGQSRAADNRGGIVTSCDEDDDVDYTVGDCCLGYLTTGGGKGDGCLATNDIKGKVT